MRFLHKFESVGTLIPLISLETKHQRILASLLDNFHATWRFLELNVHGLPSPRNFSLTAGPKENP